MWREGVTDACEALFEGVKGSQGKGRGALKGRIKRVEQRRAGADERQNTWT